MQTQPASEEFVRGRRAAAVWVAGVGAGLLVVAAGLFVAVRWSDMPPEAKLAVILGLTGGFLLAGHALRPTLPATGGVLYHLGAFLIPVDLAAINLRLGMSWQELLLAEGLLGVVAFGALSLPSDSVTLRYATAMSVIVTALGIGAVTVVPASVALAVVAAVVSIRLPRSRATLAWAATAGFLPVVVLALGGDALFSTAFDSLGLLSAVDPVAAIGAGALASVVLGRAAHLERDVTIAFLALGALASGGLSAWLSADLPRTANVVGPAAIFVIVEVIALALNRDAFWRRPAHICAAAGEIGGLCVALASVQLVAMAPVIDSGFFAGLLSDPLRAEGAAFGLVSLGLCGSALRYVRRGELMLPEIMALGAAVCAVAGVEVGTLSPVAVGASLAVMSGLLLLVRRLPTDVGAVIAAIYAPLAVHTDGRMSVALGVVVATMLTAAAVDRLRDDDRLRGGAMAVAAVLAFALGSIFVGDVIGTFAAGLAFIAACSAIAIVAGSIDRDIALIVRTMAVGVLLASGSLSVTEQLVVAVVLVVLFWLEAVRTFDVRNAFAAVVPLQIVVVQIGVLAELETGHIGVLLCAAALVWTGIAMTLPHEWRMPMWAAAALAVVLGDVFASADAAAFGAALIVSGGLGLGAGLLGRAPILAHVSGAIIVIGTWIELGTGGIGAAEAYVAPVALHLLVAGRFARVSQRVGSWVAYAPAVAMLGGAGVIERVGGGTGWHAVVAGSVGVVAVSVGGWRRLAGPLFTGTMVLAVVVGFESLAVVATIPTWAWLALGGSALLTVGVALERTDTSPTEAGRRVVDAISTNFS